MKKSIIYIAVFVLSFSSVTMAAQQSNCCKKSTKSTNLVCENSEKNKSEKNTIKAENEISFTVSGNCTMCKARIEKAALSVTGVQTADWSPETKILKVSYNDNVNKSDIEKAIADVGHDTPAFKAKNNVYNALPGCCKYER